MQFMEPAVLHGLSHGPKLKTIKRRREFTPRRNKLVHEVACWRCHQQRLVHVPGQPSAVCRCGECCIVSRMSLSVSLRARHNRALRFQIGNRYTGQGRTARAKLRSSDTATPCSSRTLPAALASRAPNGLRSSASAALRRRSAAHTPAAGTCHGGGCSVARTWSSKSTTAAMTADSACNVGS